MTIKDKKQDKPKVTKRAYVKKPNVTHGKPSKFTNEVFQSIIERIADGEPLRQICREEGMPNYRTFYDWIDRDNALLKSEDEKQRESALNLSARFARARDDGYDAIAVDTLKIADDGTNDWMEKFDKDGKCTGYILNGEHVQRSKLRIETRLKLLAKWNPTKYGDKVDLNHGNQPDNPFTILLQQVSGTSFKPVEEGEDD